MARKWSLDFGVNSFQPGRGAVTGAAQKIHAAAAQNVPSFAFDDTTDEYIAGSFIMPDEYALGTVKARVFFAAAGSTGTAVFRVGVQAVTPDVDTLNMTTSNDFDTTSTDLGSTALTAAGYLRTQDVTIAASDNWSKNDLVTIALNRHNATDTATGDLYLFRVLLFHRSPPLVCVCLYIWQ